MAVTLSLTFTRTSDHRFLFRAHCMIRFRVRDVLCSLAFVSFDRFDLAVRGFVRSDRIADLGLRGRFEAGVANTSVCHKSESAPSVPINRALTFLPADRNFDIYLISPYL